MPAGIECWMSRKAALPAARRASCSGRHGRMCSRLAARGGRFPGAQRRRGDQGSPRTEAENPERARFQHEVISTRVHRPPRAGRGIGGLRGDRARDGLDRRGTDRRGHLPRAVPAPVPLHSRAELDERSERACLLQGRVPPFLPVQPVRLAVGAYVLGSRGQPRPGALARVAGGDPRDGRRAGVLGQRGRRQGQHERSGDASQSADGGDLHRGEARIAGAGAGLQHRPWPDVQALRGQPGAGHRLGRVPRPEGVLVRA